MVRDTTCNGVKQVNYIEVNAESDPDHRVFLQSNTVVVRSKFILCAKRLGWELIVEPSVPAIEQRNDVWTLLNPLFLPQNKKWRMDHFEPSVPAIEQRNDVWTILNPLFLPLNEQMTYRPFWTLYSCHRTNKWHTDLSEPFIPARKWRNDVSTVLNPLFLP